jgi:hypothetical protein
MEDKPKKTFHRPNQKPRDTFMPPETMGKMKGPSVWDFSIDELIEYRMTGHKPQRILDADVIRALAKIGVSLENIAGLFSVSKETIINNSAFLTAHKEGRAECGTRIRAAIVEHAMNGSLDAQKYLDKIMGGDIEVQTVNMNVTARPLEQIPLENLIDVIENTDD